MKYLRRLISVEEFITTSIQIHNNKYDYSCVNITSARTKIDIVCPHHGKFSQFIGSHLKGSGCMSCFRKSITFTQATFLEKSIAKHGDYYDYSQVQYVNSDQPVKIICPKHGVFEQRPYLHIRGTKCGYCAKVKKKTTEQFICEAVHIHGNKYDYSMTQYKGANNKIEIICPAHGNFWITPDAHLNGKQGCRACTTCISLEETIWLNLMKIPEEFRQYKVDVNTTAWLKVDGFDPITNTVYEYNGDYYHGNPSLYASDKVNHRCGLTFGELYQKTLKREQLLKSLGFNVVSIWGSDFKRQYKHQIAKYKREHGSKKVCTVG